MYNSVIVLIIKRVQTSSAAGAALAKEGKAPGCCGRKLSNYKKRALSTSEHSATVVPAAAIKALVDAPASTASTPASGKAAVPVATGGAVAPTTAVPVQSSWDLDGDGRVEASEIAAIVGDTVKEKAILWRNGLELAAVNFFQPIFA